MLSGEGRHEVKAVEDESHAYKHVQQEAQEVEGTLVVPTVIFYCACC